MSSGAPTPDDSEREVVWYFIDEAGTPTLFDRRGRKSIVGTETSRYFLLGKLEVDDPVALSANLDGLRKELLADPYLRSVPSMQPKDKKTAIMFHAKDDVPEVREHVFKLLMRQELRFAAVVRDKFRLVEQVKAQNEAESRYRYNENEIYDELVSQLFKTSFHQADHFELVFASRGEKNRSAALKTALRKAKQIYEQSFGVTSKHTLNIVNSSPIQHVCLQAVDYFLWALQRFYEKGEDRYWNFVWPKVRAVHDLDDTREQSFGTIYTPKNPLTKEARAEK